MDDRMHASDEDLFSRLTQSPHALAIVATEGEFTFQDLASAAGRAAAVLRGSRTGLDGARVGFLIPPGYRCTVVLLGIWGAGGVAVPLATSHPTPELRHVIDDADVSVIVASGEYAGSLEPIVTGRDIRMVDADAVVSGSDDAADLPALDGERRALILYTSGSTGRPKGVVWRHRNIEAQLRILSEAWRWEARDRVLLVLPLHHVHGLINVLGCALWNGATCEILPRFEATKTLERMANGDISIFMAVPTIYRRLITAWEARDAASRRNTSTALSRLRLMVSGSAALPVATLERWREISGHTLLERYGMTEIGMALSNPYEGERIPGAVGVPLPSVEIKLVDDNGRRVSSGTQGEIEVRGPSVFEEYWRRPEATAETFHAGWFRSGDAAVERLGIYRILGRLSVDIIKSGGEKISALEVEDVLRPHPSIKDCAVVGVADPDWGERVVVAVVPAGDALPELEELRNYARRTLAPHKLPRTLLVLDELPRNALGKVVKPALIRML